MSRNEMINRWLKVSRWTPSADNLQPWNIQWQLSASDEITFKLTVNKKSRSAKTADIALNNMALGSLTQNLVYLASTDGYALKSILPIDNGFSLLFSAVLNKETATWEDLILSRQTRRGPYKKVFLAPYVIDSITKIAGEHPGIKTKIFDQDLKQITRLICAIDIIRYQNDYHLQHFLKAVRMENDCASDGIDIRTLEVPSIGQWAIKALVQFPALCQLLHAGLERVFIELGCAKLLLNSSAILHISCENLDQSAWFDLGRCLQKIWLKLTQEGISAQPFGHPLISFDCHHNPGNYSEKHNQIVQNAYEGFLKLNVDIYQPGIFLRIGYPLTNTPVARSQRYPITQIASEF